MSDKPGRATVRDDGGVITGAYLSPETAREMNQARRTKEERVEEETDELLVSMGYPNPAEASPEDRILARKAAEKGNVGAMRLLLAQSGKLARLAQTSAQANFNGVGKCPTCGHEHTPPLRVELPPNAVERMAELLLNHAARARAEGAGSVGVVIK